MIYAVRMRGNTDAGNFAGLSTSFTDLYDDWYKGYVKWAQSAGIIAGKNATTFDPDGSVTGTEAAKMLLVLAGYTSDKAGLTGINWETNTIKYASQAGLLDNMDNVDLSKALPRQYAAQLIYNALFTPMVKWSNDSEEFEEITNKTQAGDDGANSVTTIGLQYMDLRFYEGVFTANYQTEPGLKDGYVRLQAPSRNNPQQTANTDIAYDLDLAWLGEEVEVLYQDNNLKGDVADLDDDDAIYDITKTGDTTVYNIVGGDLQNATDGADKIKFGGTSYSASTDIAVYVNYIEQEKQQQAKFTATDFDVNDADDTNTGLFYGNSADTIKFIVDETTGKIDTAYIVDKTVGVITTLTSTKVAIRGLNNGGIQTIEDENIALYDGAAKGDIVYFYTQFADDAEETIVEKATTVTGTIDSISGSNITIDGTTYKLAKAGDGAGNIDDEDYEIAAADLEVGDEYEVVLYGNYWVGAKALDEGSKDYAMVLGSEGSAVNGTTVKLLLADNTTKVLTVHDKSEYDPDDDIMDENAAVLVAYTLTDDGVKLTKIETGEGDNDFSDTISIANALTDKAYTKKTQTLSLTTAGDKVAASNAVAFLRDCSNEEKDKWEWKAYSIDQLGDVEAEDDIAINGRTNDDGYVTVFAFQTTKIKDNSGATDLVGFVTGKGTITKEGDDKIISFPVWDGTTTQTVKFLNGDEGTMAAGQFIKIEKFNPDTKYDAADVNFYYGDTTLYADDDFTANKNIVVKVKEFNTALSRIVVTDEVYDDTANENNGAIVPGTVGDVSLALADGYKIIGVTTDADNRAGYETTDVSTYTDGHDENGDDTSKNNAMIILNDDGEVAYIFIDSDNAITVPNDPA